MNLNLETKAELKASKIRKRFKKRLEKLHNLIREELNKFS